MGKWINGEMAEKKERQREMSSFSFYPFIRLSHRFSPFLSGGNTHA